MPRMIRLSTGTALFIQRTAVTRRRRLSVRRDRCGWLRGASSRSAPLATRREVT